jgi:hypothetical protein
LMVIEKQGYASETALQIRDCSGNQFDSLAMPA